MIDSRDFLCPPPRRKHGAVPAGAKIAFGGGMDYNDHDRIWAALDKVHAKHAT